MSIKKQTQEQIEAEMDKKNEEFTEALLKGKATLTDISPFSTSDYIKCEGQYMEKIEGRLRLAFVRCPKCGKHIGVYDDEIDERGRTGMKRCLCGFKKCLKLKKWKI